MEVPNCSKKKIILKHKKVLINRITIFSLQLGNPIKDIYTIEKTF